MELRLGLLAALLVASGTGCAVFFGDQAEGGGGAGAGGGTTSSSSGGSGAGGPTTSGAGGGPACVGLQSASGSWLLSFADTEIHSMARVPGVNRVGFVGEATAGAPCTPEGLEGTGRRLFYGELGAQYGDEVRFFDLGPADEGSEVTLTQGGGQAGTYVLWKRGNVLCMNRNSIQVGGEIDVRLDVSEANPCGLNPALQCRTNVAIAELHGAATTPPTLGFRAAGAGTLECDVPTPTTRVVDEGAVIVVPRAIADEFDLFPVGPQLTKVRSSGVEGANEARIVGYCTGAGGPCTSEGYLEAYLTLSTSVVGTVQMVPMSGDVLDPPAPIVAHPTGYAFTGWSLTQPVLNWGTDDGGGGYPVEHAVFATQDGSGRSRVTAAAAIGPINGALIAGELASTIEGGVVCSTANGGTGTCAFVIDTNGGNVDGGAYAQVRGGLAESQAYATGVLFTSGWFLMTGGYVGGPLGFGPLEGFDAHDTRSAFIVRGQIQ